MRRTKPQRVYTALVVIDEDDILRRKNCNDVMTPGDRAKLRK